MTVIAFGSVKGAPGVTTTILALAAVWPDAGQLLIAELDPDGGVLAARLGLGFEPGLVTLAAGLRHGGNDLLQHAQPLGPAVRAVVAPAASEQVHASILTAGERLASALGGWASDVLVDCGRLASTSPVLDIARSAALTLLLARPRLDDVALVRARMAALRRAGVGTRMVLVGDGPYDHDEVAAAVGDRVLAVLPSDVRTAAALNGRRPGRPGRRSPLLRSAGQLAAAIVAHREPAVTPLGTTADTVA